MKTYTCFKKCGFIGNNLGEMYAHYKAEPTHHRLYGKQKRAPSHEDFPAVEPVKRGGGRPRKAKPDSKFGFGNEFTYALGALANAIDKWTSDIEILRGQLSEMKGAYQALSKAKTLK